MQRPGRGVVGIVLTHWLLWYPQNPPIINFYLETSKTKFYKHQPKKLKNPKKLQKKLRKIGKKNNCKKIPKKFAKQICKKIAKLFEVKIIFKKYRNKAKNEATMNKKAKVPSFFLPSLDRNQPMTQPSAGKKWTVVSCMQRPSHIEGRYPTVGHFERKISSSWAVGHGC